MRRSMTSMTMNKGIDSTNSPDRAPDRGILVLAYGAKRYIRMAEVLARSLAINSPCIPRAVVTDSSDQGLADLYDHVVPFRPELGSGLTQKVYLDLYSPFKETLFIDSDCLVIRDLEYLWDKFEGTPFGVVGSRQASGESTFHPRVEALLDKLERDWLPVFNGGLYFFRDDDASKEVFEVARRMMPHLDEYGLTRIDGEFNEETAFAVSLSSLRIEPIPDDGSIMRCTYYLFGRLHIDVSRNECEYFCRKTDSLVKPAIVHLLAPMCANYIYRREALKIRAVAAGVPRRVASTVINTIFNPPYIVYASIVRGLKRIAYGQIPIMPLPLWEVRQSMPAWRPPWKERLEEKETRYRWKRSLLSRLRETAVWVLGQRRVGRLEDRIKGFNRYK